MKQYKSMAVGGSHSGVHEIHSPWDGSLVGTVESVDHNIVDRALQAAYDIYRNRDRWLSGTQRIEILTKAKEILATRIDELALQAAREGGKPLIDSRVELARAVDGLQSCVECVRTSHGEEIPMGITVSSANRIALTRHEPIGVVLAYSAFNHPMNLIVHQVAPAVAAGCPVIIKPATDTALSCFAFVEILREAGLPEAYCQALVFDVEIAESLVSDPRVGFFSFIGSAKVGWMLRSKLAPGTRCALEHGGAAPVILAEDADLNDCIPLIAKGGFYHAGQVCVSVQRVYTHRSIVKPVCAALKEQADKMRIGDPADENTDVGPLIRSSEVKRVEQWVNEAVSDGAQLICGGRRLSDSTYACTVLLDPDDQTKVSREEIFGPVICVYSYDDIESAIERANSLPFSFQASVFSRNIDKAMYCYRNLQAAAVMINDHTAFRVDWMPFAGHQHSGYGTGGIRYTFEEMQAKKLMVLRSANL